MTFKKPITITGKVIFTAMLRVLSLALLAVSSEAGCTVKSLQCYVDTPQRILNPNNVGQGDITQECVG